MWKQPFENEKELRESYLKMPPDALLIRKMGANIAVNVEEIGESSMVLGTTAEKTHSVHRKRIGYPDFLCRDLGGCDVPKLAGVGGNDGVTRYRVYHRCCHAYMGLSRSCAVCSMERGLFVRNFKAFSNGSSTIARRQFLNALSLLSARSCEPVC